MSRGCEKNMLTSKTCKLKYRSTLISSAYFNLHDKNGRSGFTLFDSTEHARAHARAGSSILQASNDDSAISVHFNQDLFD